MLQLDQRKGRSQARFGEAAFIGANMEEFSLGGVTRDTGQLQEGITTCPNHFATDDSVQNTQNSSESPGTNRENYTNPFKRRFIYGRQQCHCKKAC
ncbi:unknown protein [Seminavis robusta]|uniref:Uncharacterized protein n=1 Tax=Seminavis robusta TaxID=568900 RepID=A0A9N8EMQ9_9STRA|nr:unknown protein [Seminavis robusta]|eukprot:Sro1382_g267920.1 n/a (96) ;mRNA; r:10811-11098